REFNCALPEFPAGTEQKCELKLEAARHPVLEDKLRRQGRAIVPIALALGGNETVLVISGPNTGGKTVALKTVGLAALSAQSGIPVAAERAQLPLFDRVLVDIGDEQSIAADLSTFSAHTLNLKAMLEAATERSLVLVDEIGTGTAPEEGSALAVALLEEFRARRCLTLEQIKRTAAPQRKQLEEERRKLQTEWVGRQRQRLAELERKFAEMGKQYEREISGAVEAVKDRELRAQLEKQARRRMVKVRAEASQEADATIVAHLGESQQDLGVAPALPQEVVRPEQLVPGVRVRVRGLG